jgi:SAM-dependent methyltransferase
MDSLELPWSEACARNEGPIAEVLAPLLLPHTRVLEIGSGTGQHAIAFARRFPHVIWQPTDRAPNLVTLARRVQQSALATCRAPIELDLLDPRTHDATDEPLEHVGLLFAANVLHIAPAQATEALFRFAARCLVPGGCVVTYGPFRYPDRALEPSNEVFDAHLKARDPQSGIRCVTDVDRAAARAGLTCIADHALPANNRARVHRLPLP